MKGEKPDRNTAKALPAFSVDTKEEAKDLQVLFCRYSYDGRYVWTGFDRTLDGLDKAAEQMAEVYPRKLSRKTTSD